MEPRDGLKIAVIRISTSNLSNFISVSARIYNERRIDKIYLSGGDFSQRFDAIWDCLKKGVYIDDVVTASDLVEYLRKCHDGVDLLVVITSWVDFIGAWYRFKRFPGWVWLRTKFLVARII